MPVDPPWPLRRPRSTANTALNAGSADVDGLSSIRQSYTSANNFTQQVPTNTISQESTRQVEQWDPVHENFAASVPQLGYDEWLNVVHQASPDPSHNDEASHTAIERQHGFANLTNDMSNVYAQIQCDRFGVESQYPSPVVVHNSQGLPYYAGAGAGTENDSTHRQLTGGPTSAPISMNVDPYLQTTRNIPWHDESMYQSGWNMDHDPLALMGQEDTPIDGTFAEETPNPFGQDEETGSKQRRTTSTKSIKCVEPDCKRRFRPSSTTSMNLCRRHQDKYDRNHAGPPVFHMLLEIDSYKAAYNRVYPKLDNPNIERDDVITANHADYWVARLIEAANAPYECGSEYHEFHSRQQKVYNGKGFKNEQVNVRMRFLYEAARMLHLGGNAVYPRGGDNEGYGKADTSLIFSERLEQIIRILVQDKRVCMDVIEGRGVTAFVASPSKYEKRKTQNKDSNERKQKKQKLGDRVQAKRKLQGKSAEGSEVDSDDYDEDEDDVNDHERAAATTLNTPASLQRPNDADADFEPSPAPMQSAGRKRKYQPHPTTTTAPRNTRSTTARLMNEETRELTPASFAEQLPQSVSGQAQGEMGTILRVLSDSHEGVSTDFYQQYNEEMSHTWQPHDLDNDDDVPNLNVAQAMDEYLRFVEDENVGHEDL